MTRGKILHLTRGTVVVRGLSMITALPTPPPGSPWDAGNRPIEYRNDDTGHNGGDDPEAVHCADWSFGNRTPTSECVGFVLWASGIDRLQPGYKGSRGEWLNCAALIDDAKGEKRFCEIVPVAKAKAADWLVTPDHIGLIIRPQTIASDVLVVDCSPRHGRKTAINTGLAWSSACIALRPKHYIDA